MNTVRFLNVEYLFTRIVDLFNGFDIVAFLNFIIKILKLITPIAIVLIIFLLYVSFYAKSKLKEMAREDEAIKKASREAAAKSGKFTIADSPASTASELPKSSILDHSAQADMELHNRWQLVQKSISSNNPADWRLAILEADIMLGDVLTKRGYIGDTIGDQLKSVEKGDMLTLNEAWEAHKIRNQIAHGGSGFMLNEREARRTIDLYKTVFSEFYHI